VYAPDNLLILIPMPEVDVPQAICNEKAYHFRLFKMAR
jgi:hypothetical protein